MFGAYMGSAFIGQWWGGESGPTPPEDTAPDWIIRARRHFNR